MPCVRRIPHASRNSPVSAGVIAAVLLAAAMAFFPHSAGAAQTEGLKSGEAPSATSEFDWFWMFYEKGSYGTFNSFTVRPFYMKNDYPGGRDFTASLMPVVFWRYRNERSTEWKSLFGLVDSLDYRHRNNVRDYDFGIFPLMLYGSSPDPDDRYFMMLPVGGTVRGKLGMDRISAWGFPGFTLFFLFPTTNTWMLILYLVASIVPAYTEYGAGDYHAHGIFWPLVQWGKSPDRDDIRVLPFYAHRYKRDRYDNYSFLVIGNYQKVITGDDEQRTIFILPVFGRRWSRSGDTGALTIFWPLFSWGYNKKAGDFELNFPWPLVMLQDSVNPQIHKRIFFPFYGRYVFNEKETFFITPLFFRLRKEMASFRSEYYVNALVFWYFKKDFVRPDAVHGMSWRFFKFWPVFHYEKDDRGNFAFNLLSLLPLRDPDGYELLYQPFWTLFEYRRFSDGGKRLGLLLRLYYQAWGDGFLRVKVPLLFSYHRRKDVLTKVTFLLSMFGYERDDAGKRMTLFWIPVSLAVKKEESAGSGRRMPDTVHDDDAEYAGDYLLWQAAGHVPEFMHLMHYSAGIF